MLRVVEHVAEVLAGDRLGEGALQRGHVDDLDLVAHALLGEERVGQEGELQRRDRALDRHLGDVDDQPAALPGAQLLGQGGGAVEGVELVDVAAEVVGHARGLLGPRRGAGGDDQVVVAPARCRRPSRTLFSSGTTLSISPSDQVDAGRDEALLGLDDLVGPVDAERDEQVPGLVVVRVVGVDDRDAPLVAGQLRAQLVHGHGPGGAGSQDEQPLHQFSFVVAAGCATGVVAAVRGVVVEIAAAIRGRASRTRRRAASSRW